MSNLKYQICIRCVMDSTMPGTVFNQEGVCNNCSEFPGRAARYWKPNSEGQRRLENMLTHISHIGSGRNYDSILGLSGGVDSSFLAFKAREWGLRPLVIHIDAGWNTSTAVANIRRIVEECDYDLKTEVIDWSAMSDLQRAYLYAGVSNQDVPQDHIFTATLLHYAQKLGIKSILSGENFATESTQMRWQHSALDSANLLAIHRAHGRRKLEGYRTISALEYYFISPVLRRIKVYRPLNCIPYNQHEAVDFLKKKGWKSYPRKHGESRFTRIFQDYILPRKFGIDKRRAHLTSLIHAEIMTRDHALSILREPMFDDLEMRREIDFLCRKLQISVKEFNKLMKEEPGCYKTYANWNTLISFMKPFKEIFFRFGS